jgi:hypothetical protein
MARACGLSSTTRHLGSIIDVSGILDRPPSRTMTAESTAPNATPHSRGTIRPRFARTFVPLNSQRAQGRPGARCTRGLVCKLHKKGAHEHTGSAETLRPSPRNGFTAYFALSLVTGFLATIAREKRLLLTNLTPASGRQNHTTSPSASRAVRQRRISVHRISPRVRDDREPPLLSGETGELIALICPTS